MLLICLVVAAAVVVVLSVLSLGLNTEQMLLKDMKSLSGSLNLAVSVLYVRLQVPQHDTLYYPLQHTLQHTTTRSNTIQHTTNHCNMK